MPIEPIEPIADWFDARSPRWYEESEQEDGETDASSLFPGRNWSDYVVLTGQKLESWRPAPSRTTLLCDYLHSLSLHFSRKERRLDQTRTELEQRFGSLAEQWRKETAHLSSITKQVMNLNYQKIIGMGPAVLPILFRELKREPSFWFWALEAITGENPTNPEDIGNVTKMSEAWLEWASARGYLNVSSARILLWEIADQQV